MNLIKSIFAIILVVSLVSCSSDDNNNQYLLTNENLAGTYNVTLLETKEVQTTNVNGVDIITTTTTTGSTFQLEIIFSGNGNVLTDGEYLNSFRVDVAGQVVEENTEIIVINSEQTNYVTNDALMTLVLDGEVYDVTLFNSTEIRLYLEDVFTDNGDNFVYTEEIRMVRQ